MKLERLLSQVYGRRVSPSEVRKLKGDASSRSYYRVTVEGAEPRNTILMQLAAEPLRSEEASTPVTSKELPFVDVQRYLRRGGIPVPQILARDDDEGLLALEDLGDVTMEQVVGGMTPEQMVPWYGRAVDLLVDLQRHGSREAKGCIAFERAFEQRLLRWELDHFVEWGLEARGIGVPAALREVLDRSFERIAGELARAERILVHRDFQSRNLMVRDQRLWLIDFQDALLGPRVYDLVALLCDSYVPIALSTQEAMLARYCDRVGIGEALRPELHRLFWVQSVQRKLKDAGRFVYIDRVKHNPSFLPYFEPSLAYVRRALERLPDFADLAAALERLNALSTLEREEDRA